MRGQMVDGEWTTDAATLAVVKGRFQREPAQFRDWVRADPGARFPAEAGRYHLYVSQQCPWAWRTILYRRLKGLEGVIGMTNAIPDGRRDGWIFGNFPGCTPDLKNGFTHLHRIYAEAKPGYTGIVSVPVLWDNQARTIVNNESSEIIRMLNSEFDALGDAKQDFYPLPLRPEIDRVNKRIYHSVNNGVYRVGFATTQDAYEEACDELFDALAWLDDRLGEQRYLVGDEITEADWRLLATLLRFDPVYHPLMRCNRRTIASYPNLSAYTRDLHQQPGVQETVNLQHIMRGYYSLSLNPSGVIPPVPEFYEAWLNAPHGRELRSA